MVSWSLKLQHLWGRFYRTQSEDHRIGRETRIGPGWGAALRLKRAHFLMNAALQCEVRDAGGTQALAQLLQSLFPCP